MYKFSLLMIAALLSVSAIAETVYKTTKPDGSVEFTDKESKDSEEVKVREPTTFSPPSLPRINLPTKKLSPSFNYELTITKPVNDTTIHNNPDVKVNIAIQPALKTAYLHKIRYQLADKSIVSESKTVVFKNVNRGSHNLKISVINANGDVISPVVSSTFHLKRFFKKPTPPKAKPKAP